MTSQKPNNPEALEQSVEGDKELHKQWEVTWKVPKNSPVIVKILQLGIVKWRWRSINHSAWCLCSRFIIAQNCKTALCALKKMYFCRFCEWQEKFLYVMFTSLCLTLETISYAHLNEIPSSDSSALFLNAIFCPRHKGDERVTFADKWLCTQ